jgi:hypothetical protein
MEYKVLDLNEDLNSYFYKKFSFILDNKVIKSGRLKLFTQKAFNLKFFLDDCEVSKAFEIPYPFAIKSVKNGYHFDYRLKNLDIDVEPEQIYSLSDTSPKSRFLNKLLIIKIE